MGSSRQTLQGVKKHLLSLLGVMAALPNWLVRHKRDWHVLVTEGRKFKVGFLGREPPNCDGSATIPDKYWEADLSLGSPFYSLRLLYILGQRISFQRETQ